MAITATAVPTSSLVPVVPAREPALALNAQREQTLATPPSAITSISSEGRLRAEFERKQIVAPNLQLAQSTNQVPANRPIPAAPARQADNEVTRRVAEQARATSADAPPSRPTSPPLTGNSANLELPNIVPQRGTPNEVPAGLQATRISSAPAARFLSASATVENIVNTSTPTTDDRIYQVKISQNASEFVAAFNEFQNKRSQALDNAAFVNQAQATSAVEIRAGAERNTPRTLENVTRPVEAGAARFDISTFAVGVARISAAQSSNQSNAPTALPSQENSNDTQRITRAEVAGQPNRASGTNRPEILPATVNAAPFRAGAAGPVPQSAAQNSGATSLDGTGVGQGGLAKHLNALANLLTP